MTTLHGTDVQLAGWGVFTYVGQIRRRFPTKKGRVEPLAWFQIGLVMGFPQKWNSSKSSEEALSGFSKFIVKRSEVGFFSSDIPKTSRVD